VRDDGVFGDDDDAVADVIKCVVELLRFAGGRNRHVVSDARVFINDGVFDLAVRADAEARPAFAFVRFNGFLRFVTAFLAQSAKSPKETLPRMTWSERLSSTLAFPNAVNATPGAGHRVLRSLDGDALAKNGAEDFHFRIA